MENTTPSDEALEDTHPGLSDGVFVVNQPGPAEGPLQKSLTKSALLNQPSALPAQSCSVLSKPAICARHLCRKSMHLRIPP